MGSRFGRYIINALDLQQSDTILRLLTIGAQILMIAVLLFGKMRPAIKIPLIGLLIGALNYLINSSVILAPAEPWRRAVDFLSISTTFWVWVFAHQLFERQIRKPLLIAVPVLLGILWLGATLSPAQLGIAFYGNHLMSLALMIHVMFIAVAGREDDLIEKRRRIRTFLPILIGMQVGGVLIFELYYGPTDALPGISAFNALLIFILTMGAGVALLIADPKILELSPGPEPENSPSLNLSPSEKVLHDKLNTAMEEGQYRTPSLTIFTLAGQLETPEHRLRALINQKLGHRNFSSFLNGYRIKEAKENLSDRTMVDLPILTIAMDLGYGSLAPFNRAFRTQTGMTPSDFRKQAIDQN